MTKHAILVFAAAEDMRAPRAAVGCKTTQRYAHPSLDRLGVEGHFTCVMGVCVARISAFGTRAMRLNQMIWRTDMKLLKSNSAWSKLKSTGAVLKRLEIRGVSESLFKSEIERDFH
ncbi:hypothetical protein AB4Y32_35315 [Paraburkholderia phymatum]|uniref:Uncharacterized protein n=1 Tax=Paraburkholderia phymatum TaxID=148447 RepID=A0ACC6UBD2_9BURK